MKKIILALLWASFLFSNVFAADYFYFAGQKVEKLTVKEFGSLKNTNISQNDIKCMVNFFNWLEDLLK